MAKLRKLMAMNAKLKTMAMKVKLKIMALNAKTKKTYGFDR